MGPADGAGDAADVGALVRHALDELPESSVMVFDSDLRYVLVRGEAVAANGLRPADFEGHPAAQVLPAARWGFYRPLYEAALRGESTSLEVASPDGSRRYVIRVRPVVDDGGLVLGGVALAGDVTELVRIADELRASERRFRLAMFSSGVGTALVDPTGRFEEVNDSLCASLGYTAAELVGRTFVDISHPDDSAAGIAGFADLQGGLSDVFRTRKRYLRPDGGVVWSDVTASALRDDAGEFLGVIAQIVDVSVEVAELEALVEREERYRLLVENAADVVFLQVDGVIEWISPSVQALIGWTVQDLTGTSTVHLWHPEDRTAALALRESVYGGAVGRGVLRFQHKDGGYVWVEVTLRPAPVERHGGMVGTMRDVSAQVSAAEALTASEDRYRLLAENASDVVLLVAPDDTITWASPSVGAVLGWDPSEAIGRHGVEFVHPDDLAGMHDALSRTREGEARTDEYRIRRADGRYSWVSVFSSPIMDSQGRLAGRVAAMRDVDEAVRARMQLQESEERFRLAMGNSVAGMCLVSPEGRFLEVNAALCAFLDRSEAQLLALTWPEVTHPEDVDADRAVMADLLAGAIPHFRREKRYVRPDGSVLWADISVGPVRKGDGSVAYLVAQLVDVTGRIAAEAVNAEHEEILRVVLDNSGDGTIRFDPQMRVEYANAQAVQVAGILMPAWLGRTLAEIGYPGADEPAWTAALGRVIRLGRPESFDYQVVRGDVPLWFEASLAPEFDTQGEVAHVIATSRDITQRRLARAELLRLATHDPLTGLANRIMLLEEIGRALTSARRSLRATGVLMIDLDRFKAVNDALGHSTGDELLLAAADRITRAVRAGDLVGRMGGDEFVVVMREVEDPEQVMGAAWRLVQDFRSPFMIDGAELFSTASIGVTICSASSCAEDSIREADTAMYAAKNHGRDQAAMFTEELRATVTSRLAIEIDLRHAIERGQLMVWYQPEVDLVTGEVIAAEALLRWKRADGEVQTAATFIDVAEESGLILGIGRWVLNEACEQAVIWRNARPQRPLTVRVNVSALQLVEGGLIDDIDAALNGSGLDPTLLCIEITESALLSETATVRSNLAHVHSRGIHIALDDFGTGYASLTYLRQYPVDLLKIDRSFVTHITTNDHDLRLVTGIVSLATALGIAVTGEGIETPEQAATLRGLGCPGAQGFLFSKAVPPERMAALLNSTHLPNLLGDHVAAGS